MSIIYRLESVKFYYSDSSDGENVEERLILGHFSSHSKLDEAKKECLKNGFKDSELSVSCFFDEFSYNQKYVYVLTHQYSILNDNRYTDYEYIFPPFSNRKKCLDLKKQLLENPKYAFSEKRCYEVQPPDGFCISKQLIDYLYCVVPK